MNGDVTRGRLVVAAYPKEAGTVLHPNLAAIFKISAYHEKETSWPYSSSLVSSPHLRHPEQARDSRALKMEQEKSAALTISAAPAQDQGHVEANESADSENTSALEVYEAPAGKESRRNNYRYVLSCTP